MSARAVPSRRWPAASSVTHEVAPMAPKVHVMQAQWTVKTRRPYWAAPCGGTHDHGRQSPRPPRSQEEAEGRQQAAEARIAARFAAAVRGADQAQAEAARGEGRERGVARTQRDGSASVT